MGFNLHSLISVGIELFFMCSSPMHIFFWWNGLFNYFVHFQWGYLLSYKKLFANYKSFVECMILQMFWPFSQLPALNSGFRRIKVLLLLKSNLLILFFNSSCFCVLFKEFSKFPNFKWLDIKEEGTYVCLCPIHVDVWQKLFTRYCWVTSSN